MAIGNNKRAAVGKMNKYLKLDVPLNSAAGNGEFMQMPKPKSAVERGQESIGDSVPKILAVRMLVKQSKDDSTAKVVG